MNSSYNTQGSVPSAPVPPTPPVYSVSQPETPKKKNLGLILALAIGVPVLVLGLGIWGAFSAIQQSRVPRQERARTAMARDISRNCRNYASYHQDWRRSCTQFCPSGGGGHGRLRDLGMCDGQFVIHYFDTRKSLYEMEEISFNNNSMARTLFPNGLHTYIEHVNVDGDKYSVSLNMILPVALIDSGVTLENNLSLLMESLYEGLNGTSKVASLRVCFASDNDFHDGYHKTFLVTNNGFLSEEDSSWHNRDKLNVVGCMPVIRISDHSHPNIERDAVTGGWSPIEWSSQDIQNHIGKIIQEFSID